MEGHGMTYFLDDQIGSAKDRKVKLSCRNIWKCYGPMDSGIYQMRDTPERASAVAALRSSGCVPAAIDVSFDVHAGEIFVIMGLSGSGKSTVIRCLSRLVEPSYGEILFDGEDLLEASPKRLIEIRRRRMGMVFQSFGLLPHLTVLENVAFPLRVQGVDRQRRESRASEMIELVGLKGRECAFPAQLSGGQQQRVGIARSLAVEPELWFLDEPFSALDPLIRRQMQNEFLRLQTLLKKTIVFITHDFLEAIRLADRIAIMKDGQIIQIGSAAEIVLKPANDYVREFTRDVPLAHVLTVADVIEPYRGHLQATQSCGADMSLLDAMPSFAGNLEGFAVTNSSGAIVGEITASKVLTIFAESQERTR
ncbi:ATP-binding cassette domain-containing protein [Mesorhizobium tamadayense]|uniref:Quaternary amine transport ATP-binding protein n=2 Tax=Mesorhizobium tamadayense TaxID=425306 RepID=A0A3P3F4X3_9HYPH|nr:ATP-binding cassette domain-containing protein [Mesorhizobium tamadayense]